MKKQNIIRKIKKYFKSKPQIVRWEIRYKNLLLKYEELEKEKNELIKMLQDDEKTKKINSLKNYNRMLFRQRKELREKVNELLIKKNKKMQKKY